MFLRWSELNEAPDKFVRGAEWEEIAIFVHPAIWPALRQGVLHLGLKGFGPWKKLAVEPDEALAAHVQSLLSNWVSGIITES